MPAAQHGYVHLSSADKDASDETDEVDLQVQCLTGEGVTLRVPLSILGYDLRRLVSEKLPCKPGAKLAVYHGNAMLALDQALGEQGITKEVAVLSSAYIPTNLYTAFRYVQGIPNGERDFVLEGVTQHEGAVPGEYLHHLPHSLAKLSFEETFNQSLDLVTLPSSLQSLSFGSDFNQSLERVTLPSNLQNLSLSRDFNRSLEQVTLPSSLQSLSFGHCFNQSLERVTLPSSLQSMSLGY